NRADSSSCPARRALTPKPSAASKCGRLPAFLCRVNKTSGGSRDNGSKELAVNPFGSPSVPRHVITATAEGQLANSSLKLAGSMDTRSSPFRASRFRPSCPASQNRLQGNLAVGGPDAQLRRAGADAAREPLPLPPGHPLPLPGGDDHVGCRADLAVHGRKLHGNVRVRQEGPYGAVGGGHVVGGV